MIDEKLEDVPVDDEFNAKCVDETQPADVPTLQQSALTVCGLMIDELQSANATYPNFFRSSAEAHGVLRRQFLKMEQQLLEVKSVDGFAFNADDIQQSAALKNKLVRMGTMCIKAAYSLCNLDEDCRVFNAQVALNTAMAEKAAELFAGLESSEGGEQ